MIVRAKIPVTAGPCTSYFEVRYKLASDVNWQTLYPNPITTPIILDGLLIAQTYDVEVVRVCCDAGKSLPAAIQVNTSQYELGTPDLSIIDVGATTVQLEWTPVAHAQSYALQISTAESFPNETETINYPPITDTSLLAEGLQHDVIYFARIKAQAPTSVDGAWSNIIQFTTS